MNSSGEKTRPSIAIIAEKAFHFRSTLVGVGAFACFDRNNLLFHKQPQRDVSRLKILL